MTEYQTDYVAAAPGWGGAQRLTKIAEQNRIGVIEGGWKEETDPPDFKAQYKKPVVIITADLSTGKIRRGTASYEVHMSGTIDGEGKTVYL